MDGEELAGEDPLLDGGVGDAEHVGGFAGLQEGFGGRHLRASRLWVGLDVLEHGFEGDGEDGGDAEGDLERGGVLVALDGVDGLAGNADAVGELLLGDGGFGAEDADALVYAGGGGRGHAALR